MFLKNMLPALMVTGAAFAHLSFFAHGTANSAGPAASGRHGGGAISVSAVPFDTAGAVCVTHKAAANEIVHRPAAEYAQTAAVITIEPSARKTNWDNRTYDFLPSPVSKPLERPVSGQTADRQQKYAEYYSLIKEKIQRNISWLAKDNIPQGTVSAVFTLSPEGELIVVDKIFSLQGDKRAERITRDGIRKAACFPRFPGELGKDPIRFSLQVNFSPNR
jgi:outer membrane biosynthesis protein TonB